MEVRRKAAYFLVTSKFIQFAQGYNRNRMEETLELKATHHVTMVCTWQEQTRKLYRSNRDTKTCYKRK